MIRVLQCVNNMHRAGLETVLMNYYRNMDRDQIQFDFLTHRPQRDDFDDEIEALGGRIYHAPRLYPQNYPAYFAYMKQLFAEHPEYRIVHSHIDAMSYLPLLAAKRAGVPVRIAHSHSSMIERDLKYPLKAYFRSRLPKVANRFCACGELAGAFLFRGKPYHWVPNAVDARRFTFDPQLRQQVRQELSLGDCLTVGHIGRLSYPKNHTFLIQSFARLLEQQPDAKLLLAGKGELEAQLRRQVGELGIGDSVRFLGSRSDVERLYQAMDVLAMPSHYEGVPMAGIEAQFAGLPCLFSDHVSREVSFTGQCEFMALEQPREQWAEALLRLARQPRQVVPTEGAAYHIVNAQKQLHDYYLEQAAGE